MSADIKQSMKEKIDQVEAVMLAAPQVDCPLRHSFTPGLYSREIFMPAGIIALSKIHKTEHPFIVLFGKLSVWVAGEGWMLIEAPYRGITKVGTRRLVRTHEDTVWITFHATDKTTVEEVEDEIIEKNDNPFLSVIKSEVTE